MQSPSLITLLAVGILASPGLGEPDNLAPRELSYLPPITSVMDESSLSAPIASDHPLDYFATAFGTRSFAAGDVNNDGLNDIVVSPGYGRYLPMFPIQIWINQGGGRFVERTGDVIEGPSPLINSVQEFLIADFNGDGRADILILEGGLEDTFPPRGGKVVAFLSQPNGKLVDKSAQALEGNVPSHYESVSMADINGDGALDLVLSRPPQPEFEGSGVLFLLNDGKGHFVPSVAGLPKEIAYHTPWCCPPYPVQNPNSNGACDLDGDGRVDLVTGSGNGSDDHDYVTNSRTIRIYRQEAGGAFVERARYSIPEALKDIGYISANRFSDTPPLGLSVLDIAFADLNGDGKPEIIILWEGSQSQIEILRNNGDFTFTDVTLESFGAYLTDRVDRPGSRVGLIRLLDVNRDGSLDLVFGTAGHQPDELVSRSFIFLNDGAGHFSPWKLRLRSEVPTAETVAKLLACNPCALLPCGPCNSDYLPLVFDANGDGVPDVVLINHRSTEERPFREKTLFVRTLLAEPGPRQRPARNLPFR